MDSSRRQRGGSGVEGTGVEGRGVEGRGGKGRAGQGRVPDCLGGLSRVGISSRSTRPWNGQPPSIPYHWCCSLSLSASLLYCQMRRCNVHGHTSLTPDSDSLSSRQCSSSHISSFCYNPWCSHKRSCSSHHLLWPGLARRLHWRQVAIINCPPVVLAWFYIRLANVSTLVYCISQRHTFDMLFICALRRR